MNPRAGRRPVVSVVLKSLPHYRIPFFEAIRPRLAAEGVDFRLIYGLPAAPEAARRDTGRIEWGTEVESRILDLGRHQVYWQPCLPLLVDTELIVVEQASKLLLNYVLLTKQQTGGPKLAYWDHGRNLQEDNASRLGEALKRYTSTRVHWWFAYTEGSARIVENLGYPRDRITVVQNTIDTEFLLRERARISREDVTRLRSHLGIEGRNVAIFAGSLYAGKDIPFLLSAARHARRILPDFELIVLGDGPEAQALVKAAAEHRWLHYVGPVFGAEKVRYFSLADVTLLPGVVGLGIVDSFVFGTPMVTIDRRGHGPEIEYLVNGENGIIVEATATPDAYAERVVALFRDDALSSRLRVGCEAARTRYTMAEMVNRFTKGTLRALSAARTSVAEETSTVTRRGTGDVLP